jgi:GDP-L-fucose synthase
MYAGDLASFLWEAAWRFDEVPEAVNVGPGTDHTVDTYYLEALSAVGYEAQLVHDLTQPVGMRHKLLAVERLRMFGWSPSISLRDGIRETYAYFQSEAAHAH